MRLAFPGLMAALAEGTAVVTPTPLLASIAVEQFNRSQLQTGNQSWERPKIQSLDEWMVAAWQQARFTAPNAPSLLSASQERELWRQIIEQDRPDLFDLRAMARLAQRASRTLAEYQIPTDSDAWPEHLDAQSFRSWHQTLESALKKENWITRSELWRLLPHWISKGVLAPGPVTFSAFTSISPGLSALSRALGDSVSFAGASFTHHNRARLSGHASILHEIEHTARAIRHQLENGSSSSIGVFVVDLPRHSRDLLRIFNQVFYPASTPRDHIHLQSETLAAHPLVASALLLLELAEPRISFSSAGAILRSPFIDGARSERSLRALADRKLRRARELDYSPSQLQTAAWDCPVLYQMLGRIHRIVAKLNPPLRLPQWSAVFSDILEKAKWPAIENLTEAERRAVDHWRSALSELASLGLVSASVSLRQAIAHLRSILARPVETGSWSSPVQILDANSAHAIEFDSSFIINACEDAWPALIPVSPLIPYKLQRLHQVPLSSPELVAEDRDRRNAALFHSSPAVHISYSGNPSPLLRSQATQPDDAPCWNGKTQQQSYEPAAIESRDDSQAPPLPLSNDVHGGSGIVKAQSQCPFKAFIEYRLTARADDEACFGFDPLARGIFAHKALEYVWRELGTLRNLKALGRDDLRQLIVRHVAEVVKGDADGPIHAVTSAAERERLVDVVFDWLEIERHRPAEFTVEHIEDEREVELSGLKLKLRIDRVDRLENGHLVLIDYKTGDQNLNRLVGERPDEPQLLVYAAALDEPIDGIYFGVLKAREAKPAGHGVVQHFPQRRTALKHPNWDRFLADSRDAVHSLINEFKAGNAAVDPKKNTSCQYCSVNSVCRIASADAGAETEE